jgi:predicted proteasome-type protease
LSSAKTRKKKKKNNNKIYVSISMVLGGYGKKERKKENYLYVYPKGEVMKGQVKVISYSG